MTRFQWFEKRGYKPHPGQLPVHQALEAGAYELDVLCGKRAGKTRLCYEEAVFALLQQSKVVWVAGPTWDIVDRLWNPLWAVLQREGVRLSEQDKRTHMALLPTGGLIEGVSWAAPQQIEARGVHFLVTDESQYLTQEIVDKFRARLVGGYVWVRIGSCAEGLPSYWERVAQEAKILPHRHFFTWPTWVNPDPETQQMIARHREELAALKARFGERHPAYKQLLRWYNSTYGAEPGPPSNAALPQFNPDIHVQDCDFDSQLPVYLAVDPGFANAYTALAFQPHPAGSLLGHGNVKQTELWQIDEVYEHGMTTSEVITLVKSHKWWPNVEKIAIDVSARHTNRQTGISDEDWWRAETKLPVISHYLNVSEGLNTQRQWLLEGRLFHDRQKCPKTIAEYYNYVTKDGSEDVIDDNNDAQKAVAYLLRALYGSLGRESTVLRIPRYVKAQRFVWGR